MTELNAPAPEDQLTPFEVAIGASAPSVREREPIDPPGVGRERPTMKDVAALANVSIKTVSRVVGNVPSVDPKLAARVRAAADKLGYRPNQAAANLRRTGGRTNTVGLLVEDVGNPFSSAVHRAVEDYVRHRNVLLLAGSLDEDPLRERELARTLVDRRVDGLIMMPTRGDHRYLFAEQQLGTQIVFIDRLPSPLLGDAVIADNHGGAAAGTRHLLATGRRRIAYLGDDLAIPTAKLRHDGFRSALAEAGLEPDPRMQIHGLRTSEQAYLAARTLLTGGEDVEAVFSSQNLVTTGVLQALHELDLQHAVAQVGFDEVPMASLIRPGVTVIAQDPGAIGRLAAERLLLRLDGFDGPPEILTIPTQLIPRGSGEL